MHGHCFGGPMYVFRNACFPSVRSSDGVFARPSDQRSQLEHSTNKRIFSAAPNMVTLEEDPVDS